MLSMSQNPVFYSMESAQKFANRCGGHFVQTPGVHADIDLGNGQVLKSIRFVRDPIPPMQIPVSAR